MRFPIILFSIVLFFSCQKDKAAQPRPHQYPRIEFPEKIFAQHVQESCPFTMSLPKYASIDKKELLFDEVAADPCWFDIIMPVFNAAVHCSYYPIGSEHTLDKLVNDAYTMASKHNIKASYREEFIVKTKYGGSGLIFKINGPVATPYQFYMTDSTSHFIRGSLYFNGQVNIDSIAPILTYVEKDIDEIINSIHWN